MKTELVIGFDLGGTHLAAAVVDADGAVVSRRSSPVRAERGPGPVIADILAAVDPLLRGAAGKRSELRAVGVAAPGPLCVSTGRIVRMANLPGWDNVPLRDTIHDALGCPVAVENDGNAAAYGEYRGGSGRSIAELPENANDGERDRCDLVMFTLGTGVGAGVVIGGRIHHGHFENAGELGHMIVAYDGLPCGCGQRGCLEQYASASAVARRVRDAMRSGEPTRLADDGPIESIDATCVVDAARAGDALCGRIWDEACRYLAVACVNVQHAINPPRILLGGGMARAGSFLLDPVREHARRNQWKLYDDAPGIELASLGTDAGAVGAAALAWSLVDRTTR